jgi:hypothetical protein
MRAVWAALTNWHCWTNGSSTSAVELSPCAAPALEALFVGARQFGSAVRATAGGSPLSRGHGWRELADRHLTADQQAWPDLVERYDGNGLALKIVGETIQQFYKGEIAAFLEDGADRSNTRFDGRYSPPVRRPGGTPLASPVGRSRAAGRCARADEHSRADSGDGVTPRASTHHDRRNQRLEATLTLQSMVLEYMTDRLGTL